MSSKARDDVRLWQLKLIHMAKRDLCMSDADYRAAIAGITDGRTESSGTCTDAERRRLLNHFRRLGWAPKKPQRRKYSPASAHKPAHEKTQADKIRAMWISLARAGVIRNRSEAALGKFCHRLTGKHTPDWLTHREAVVVIEALHAWARREHVTEVVQA